MRILVCGSRTYRDAARVKHELDQHQGDVTLIEGGALGADDLAMHHARRRGWRVLTFHAEWGKHGKAAGPIRNQRMLDEGQPNLVLAFVDKPLARSRGTRDMVQRALAAGVTVKVIEP